MNTGSPLELFRLNHESTKSEAKDALPPPPVRAAKAAASSAEEKTNATSTGKGLANKDIAKLKCFGASAIRSKMEPDTAVRGVASASCSDMGRMRAACAMRQAVAGVRAVAGESGGEGEGGVAMTKDGSVMLSDGKSTMSL